MDRLLKHKFEVIPNCTLISLSNNTTIIDEKFENSITFQNPTYPMDYIFPNGTILGKYGEKRYARYSALIEYKGIRYAAAFINQPSKLEYLVVVGRSFSNAFNISFS